MGVGLTVVGRVFGEAFTRAGVERRDTLVDKAGANTCALRKSQSDGLRGTDYTTLLVHSLLVEFHIGVDDLRTACKGLGQMRAWNGAHFATLRGAKTDVDFLVLLGGVCTGGESLLGLLGRKG